MHFCPQVVYNLVPANSGRAFREYAVMGRDTVNFKCHHCSHCCRDVVCLPTPWDVLRIAMETGENPHEFLEFLTPEEIEGVNKNDPTWLRADGEKYLMALRRDETKGCYFLDKKTRFCRIYESRPFLCRLYPFRLEETRDGKFKGFTLHTKVGCPRNRDGVHETAPMYELYKTDRMHHEDYDTLVAAFNKQDRPGRRPQEFLDLFIEVVIASK